MQNMSVNAKKKYGKNAKMNNKCGMYKKMQGFHENASSKVGNS